MAVALLLGCGDRSAGGDEGAPPRTVTPAEDAVAPPQPCRVAEGSVLTWSEDGRCGHALVASPRGAKLLSLEPASAGALATGPLPPPCESRRCEFSGHDSPLGPLVLAVVPDPGSEMPAGVWLGAPIGGGKLAFVDLWAGAGPDVHGDATELGPAYALSPHACGGKLALFAAGRVNASSGVPVPAELAAREGVYTWSQGGMSVDASVARDGCESLGLPVP